ncbi:MAG TPA: LytTR family DNA-binding domain-containing protein [Thermoanaerobaculia bacterium]|jgi:two-component system LytT family response regulator
MKLRAVILDDEPLARARLRSLLERDSGVEVVGDAAHAVEALRLVAELAPDLVFVDVRLPEESGLEFLRMLDPVRRPVVIFTTAYPEYAVDAFDVAAADYLLKPLDAERVLRAVNRARRLLGGGRAAAQPRPVPPRELIAVPVRDEILFVKSSKIDWILAERNYSRLHCGAASYLLRESLQSIEQSLDPATFIRVHRSAIVNLDRVRKLVSSSDTVSSIALSTGAIVPLGPAYRSRLEEVLGRKLKPAGGSDPKDS